MKQWLDGPQASGEEGEGRPGGEQIDEIIKKKKIDPGILVNCGVHMTNTYAALEAHQRLDEAREQEEAVAEKGRTEMDHSKN